jgi:Na+-driven multidrug efflux pump
MWDTKLAKQVFQLGLPPLLMQLTACVLQAVQMRQIAYYGNLYGIAHGYSGGDDIAVGAFGIVFVVSLLAFLPILGLNQGVQPIVGYNIGARHYDRVAHSLRLAMLVMLIFTFIFSAAFFMFPEALLYPFSNDKEGPELLQLCCHAVRIFVLMLPAAGMTVVMTGYLQSNGSPKLAILLTAVRQIIFYVPLILILPPMFESHVGTSGLDGIWFAFPICDFATFIFVLLLLVHEFKRLKRLHRKTENDNAILETE